MNAKWLLPFLFPVILLGLSGILVFNSYAQRQSDFDQEILDDCFRGNDAARASLETQGNFLGDCDNEDFEFIKSTLNQRKQAFRNQVLSANVVILLIYGIVVAIFFRAPQDDHNYANNLIETIGRISEIARHAFADDKKESNLEIVKYALQYKTISAFRINTYIKRLGRRGDFTLAIAVVPAGVFIFLFIYVLLQMLTFVNTNGVLKFDDTEFWKQFGWIIVFAGVFLQTLTIFLLQSYRRIRLEIRFYQNELTNIEMWYASLSTALLCDDADTAKSIVEKFAVTERNFATLKESNDSAPQEGVTDAGLGSFVKSFVTKTPD